MPYQWRRWGYDPVVEEAARRRAAVAARPRWGGLQYGQQGRVVRPVGMYDEAVEDLGGTSWTQWQRAQAQPVVELGAVPQEREVWRTTGAGVAPTGYVVTGAPRVAAQPGPFGQAAVAVGGGYPATVRPRTEAPATMGAGVRDVETAGRRGGGGGQYYEAPRGVPAGWYKAFQKEHGETPERYYARVGEGLDEALADKDWSEGFARDAGRPPSEQEWENWYYHSRRGGRPGPPPGSAEYDVWKAGRRELRKKRRAAWLRKHRPQEPEVQQASWRPKVVPQPVTWRVGAR